MARFAPGTAAISLSAALRDISTRMASAPTRMVAPRLRPLIRPTSPKMEPVGMGTVRVVSFASTSTSTCPSAMAKSEEPGALRSKTTSPARQKRTSLSSRNSRSWSGETSSKIATRLRMNSSHASTLRPPGKSANLCTSNFSSTGFKSVLPAINSTTSCPWFIQCLISG